MFDFIKQVAIPMIDSSTSRDWGQSIVLRNEKRSGKVVYREKFLIFKPYASIVLESHDNYDEIWMPDNNLIYYLENETGNITKYAGVQYERILVCRGKKHKIINPGNTKMCIFEIQIGHIDSTDKRIYLSEDGNYGS